MQVIPPAFLKHTKQLNGLVYIITSGNILHCFIAIVILEVYDPESQ